jgi:hypothetical protein
MPLGRKDVSPAGAYELRFRLERSYRPFGWCFLASGIVGFFVAIVTFHPWVFLITGSAMGAGLWLIRHDIREDLVVLPRTHRLRLTRAFGRKVQVRREYNLREFVRLETASYLLRPKGLRCMILLFRADGGVEKVDDRLHEKLLIEQCRQAAEAAGLAFIDRGRIDAPAPARLDGDDGVRETETPLDA